MIWSARLRTTLGHAHAERPRRLQVDDEPEPRALLHGQGSGRRPLGMSPVLLDSDITLEV
jgi:hypothetical protein